MAVGHQNLLGHVGDPLHFVGRNTDLRMCTRAEVHADMPSQVHLQKHTDAPGPAFLGAHVTPPGLQGGQSRPWPGAGDTFAPPLSRWGRKLHLFLEMEDGNGGCFGFVLGNAVEHL